MQPIAGLVRADGRAARRTMVLDTLFLDIGARPRDAHVFLCWRATFEPDVFTTAVLMEARDLGAVDEAVARRAA